MSVVFWEVATATHETNPIKSTDETMKESLAAKKTEEDVNAPKRAASEEYARRRIDDSCSVRSGASTASAASTLTLVSISAGEDEFDPSDDLEFWELASDVGCVDRP